MKASKLELWWWLIFNHKKFDRWIKVNESIVRENTTQKLEKQFERKLEFIAIEKERDSILSSGFEYPVLYIPIRTPSSLQPYNPDSFRADRSSIQADVYNRQELTLPFSYSNERCDPAYMVRVASKKLSEALIEASILKTRFRDLGPEGKVIEFYVNIYRK